MVLRYKDAGLCRHWDKGVMGVPLQRFKALHKDMKGFGIKV